MPPIEFVSIEVAAIGNSLNNLTLSQLIRVFAQMTQINFLVAKATLELAGFGQSVNLPVTIKRVTIIMKS